MKYTFCGMEIVRHKKPIQYDPLSHFKDVIQERLDKVEKLVVPCKK